MNRTFLLGTLMLFLCTACEKQSLKRAEKSLHGTWEVTKINSAYGERVELGTQTNEEFNEAGDLGIFTFKEDSVTYNYTRLDTLYNNTNKFAISREKVNSGFTKVEVYTLLLGNKTYICRFGDETKNAEKNATEITLEYETTEPGRYTSITYWLEKQQ